MTSMISAPFALSPQHQPGTASDTALDSGSPVETQQNWLARFLHIKPATKTLCFQVGRGLARQEIVRLLREWKCFGVKDVSFDRKTNVILARVDKNNRECLLLSSSTHSLDSTPRSSIPTMTTY